MSDEPFGGGRTLCAATLRPQTVPRVRDRGRRRGPGQGAVHDGRRVGDDREHPRVRLPAPPPAPPAAQAAGAEAAGLRPRPPAPAGSRPGLAARRLGAAALRAARAPPRAARRPAPHRPGRGRGRSPAAAHPGPGLGRSPDGAAGVPRRDRRCTPGLVGGRARAAVGPGRRHPARRHRAPPVDARDRRTGRDHARAAPRAQLRRRPAPRRPRRRTGAAEVVRPGHLVRAVGVPLAVGRARHPRDGPARRVVRRARGRAGVAAAGPRDALRAAGPPWPLPGADPRVPRRTPLDDHAWPGPWASRSAP